MRLFNAAFYAGIASFVLMISFVLLLFVTEQVTRPSPDFHGFAWAQPVAVALVSLFACSVLLLWIEGWILVVSYWSRRGPFVNAFCVAFLLLGAVFAAFTFHFLELRRRGSNSMN